MRAPTSVFTLLGSAMGVAVVGGALLAYAPTLHASEDTGMKRQLTELKLENQALRDRLDQVDAALLAAGPGKDPTARKKRSIGRSRKAKKNGKPAPGNQSSHNQPPPKTVAEGNAEFRARVRKALEQELEQLDAVAADVEALQKDVGPLVNHTHEFDPPPRPPRAYMHKRGFDAIEDDALIPYVPQSYVGKDRPDVTFETTAPK